MGSGSWSGRTDGSQTLFDLYSPLLSTFLEIASAHLTKLASAEQATQLFSHGFTPLAWLGAPATRPPTAYLASCAVSLPLIGLTQLAQYVVLGKGSDLGPHEFGAKFNGATGHSQGVISAAVIAARYPAASTTTGDAWDAFYAHALHGLTVLFQIGLQGSIVFPTLSLAPNLVASSLEHGEGVPTPMLAVTGLELASLQKKIAEVNGFVKGEGREPSVGVSLFNGNKAFVVTGLAKDLVGLADGLRKGRAETGKDQSKV